MLVKQLIKILIAATFTGVLFVLLCNLWVVSSTHEKSYFVVDSLPSNQAGLVLGTSKNTSDGEVNLYFKYRMEAAARLYNEGKIKSLIVSGNNDSRYYNEPKDMERALMRLGVPRSAITLDYAGYRTFDSVVRSKTLFRQNNITIVSQDFHNARALYIAQNEGLNAVAFAAQDVPAGYSIRTLIREYLARPKAVFDVHFYRPATAPNNRMR